MLTHNPSLENAVASFFTPTSQKPKDRVVWSERAPDNDTPATLLVARYEPDAAKETQGTEDTSATKRRRIAAFDLVRADHPGLFSMVVASADLLSRTLL